MPLYSYFFKNYLVQSVQHPLSVQKCRELVALESRETRERQRDTQRKKERERGRKSRVDGVELMKTRRRGGGGGGGGGEGLTSVLDTGPRGREGREGIVLTRKVNERGELAP